jgi:hypothetical protein
MAPFKDTFRSTSIPQQCTDPSPEKYPLLETVVAVLSTG